MSQNVNSLDLLANMVQNFGLILQLLCLINNYDLLAFLRKEKRLFLKVSQELCIDYNCYRDLSYIYPQVVVNQPLISHTRGHKFGCQNSPIFHQDGLSLSS